MTTVYMDSPWFTSTRFRCKTRTYIRLFVGEAISQPTMYAHPGASSGRWPQGPQSGTGFTGVDIFYLIEVLAELLHNQLRNISPGTSHAIA
jgi:hypothetical protein